MQDVVISDPKDGVPFYGLTEKGRQQAKEVWNNDVYIAAII